MKYTSYIVFSVGVISLEGSQEVPNYTVSGIKVNTTSRNFNNKILLFWKYFCYCKPFVLKGIIYFDTVWCYSIFIFMHWSFFTFICLVCLIWYQFEFVIIWICFPKFTLCFNALFSFFKLVIMIFCPCLFVSLHYYNFHILPEPKFVHFSRGKSIPLSTLCPYYSTPLSISDWNREY